ncbi:MAG: hypothetical protein WAQ98_18505 [Blastocatellia bacterium]
MLTKHIIGIDLDINRWNVAIASIDTRSNQVVLDHVGTYSNIPDLKQKLSKYSISKTIYSISNQYSVSFVVNPLTNLTVDGECRSRRIGNDQNADFFNFGSNSVLVALPKNNVVDILGYHQALGLKQPFSVNATDIELGYLLQRNYSHHQILTLAILNFQQQHIGISVYQNGSIKHISWIDLEENELANISKPNNISNLSNTNNLTDRNGSINSNEHEHNVKPATSANSTTVVGTTQTELNKIEFVVERNSSQINNANSDGVSTNSTNTTNSAKAKLISKIVKSLSGATQYCDPVRVEPKQKDAFDFHYNLVLLAGLVPDDIALELRAAASAEKLKISDIEFVEPLRSNLINISSLTDSERIELERNSHQYAVAIESIAMQAENLGINLALPTGDYKNNKLDKKISLNAEIKVSDNVVTKLATSAVANAKLIAPSLVNQKYLLLVATLSCLIIASYRYYSYNNEIASIQNDYTSEKNREVLLLGVKDKFESLERKNKSKNELINSIKNIQKTQMLVPTIVGDIQNLTYRTTFRGLITISELDVVGTDIKVAGKALDKFRVAAFASELQSSNYEDVIPAKYTAVDNVQGTYEIVTKYTGSIPKNPVLLPKQSPVQLMNINQTNNQTNQGK